jgi:hypothetical protein
VPRVERVEQLKGKAPFSKRFEDSVGRACESASARQVARRFGLAESTARAVDLRYLDAGGLDPKHALKRIGVDEIHLHRTTSECKLSVFSTTGFHSERIPLAFCAIDCRHPTRRVHGR